VFFDRIFHYIYFYIANVLYLLHFIKQECEMKKVATLAVLMMAAFSAQAADLYLYAGAGLKEPVEKNYSAI